MVGFRNSNPARSGFGENLFWDDRTIAVMKLIVSTMLSSVVKRQCSSVFLFYVTVCQFLKKFIEFCIFVVRATLTKIANK